MRKAMVLAVGLGLALLGFGAETAPFGSVVGWWRFNDASKPGKDSSEYGNDLVFGEDVSRVADDTVTAGCYAGGGCLYLGEKGATATCSPTTTWSTSTGYTYLMRSRNDGDSIEVTSILVPKENRKMTAMASDKNAWHLIAMRYDNKKVTGGDNKYYYWLFGDNPTIDDDAGLAQANGDSGFTFPLSNDIVLGGTVAASISGFTKSMSYKGYLDDVCVVQRTMSKDEINHYYHYGDPNPYLTSSGGWSCAGENLGYAAADLPGADFQVDCGRTRTISNEGGTFGGHSLILGRPADLVSVVDSSKKLTKTGNLTVKTNYTFTDLRMFAGTLTGTSGKALTVNKLTVNATSESPYAVTIASGTYTLSGAAVGGGWIAKTGAGTLDLSGLTGEAKVRLDAGTLKAAKLDGFTGGTVLVSKGSTVAFTGEGTLPTSEHKMIVQFDGEKPTAKTSVMTVPNGVTAAMIRDTTDYGTGWAGSRVTVENGTVYVEPVKDIRSEVTTTEKVGLAYNRLDVGVTLATPGATGVKVVLMDGQGATVATETAEFTDGTANVGFRDLTPGETYQYDVFLVGGESEVPPTDWETVSKDLFKSVDWFGFASGAFLKATPDANIVVADEMYASKDNALGLVTPNAAPIEGERTVIEMQVEVGGAYAWNDLPALEGKQLSFGIVLKEGETADTPANRVWAYKLGSGNWTALPASTAPVADGTYDLRAVLDYRAGHKVASCTLTADSVDYELFSNVPLAADRMNRVGVIGGNVVSQDVGFPCIISPTEVEPKGTEIELDASAAVDLAKLTAGTAYTVKDNGYALCWTDAGGRYATKSGNTLTAHEGVPANGLESFTSHALGLDPTDELDKPVAVVKEGGMQAADGVTVHVPNVVRGNLPDAGVEVLFQRQKSTDGGKTWTDDGAAVSVGGDLKIPFDGNLYRVNTVLR